MRRVPHFGPYKNIAHMARRKTSTNKDKTLTTNGAKLKCNMEQRTPVSQISHIRTLHTWRAGKHQPTQDKTKTLTTKGTKVASKLKCILEQRTQIERFLITH